MGNPSGKNCPMVSRYPGLCETPTDRPSAGLGKQYAESAYCRSRPAVTPQSPPCDLASRVPCEPLAVDGLPYLGKTAPDRLRTAVGYGSDVIDSAGPR